MNKDNVIKLSKIEDEILETIKDSVDFIIYSDLQGIVSAQVRKAYLLGLKSK